MKVSLLDVNMLIALAWPSHVHHRQAHGWFSQNAARGWATCPLTQCAFVRISSNPKIIPEAVMPAEALALLRQMVGLKTHTFWKDEIGILDKSVPSALLVGHRQITDAYLLGLAIRHDGRLVTLDGGVADLLPPGSPHRDALHVLA
ncbi:MAG: TA system VapC family ribonuclease toxin [Kiritimatiellia bacterium]